MEKYIGVKIIHAEKAIRKGGKVYLLTDPMPRSMEPEEEGYEVVYEDRYTSWSPKEAFEKAYRKIDGLTIGLAIESLNKGFKRIARKGWNGKGIFVELQKPDENSKMTYPYLFIDTTGLQTDNPNAPKNRVPWAPSQTDLLAEDWMIVE